MHAQLFLIGLNHRSAPLDIRERFALDTTAPSALGLIRDQGPIQEVLRLSTCNRVEILAVGGDQAPCLQQMLEAWAARCGRSRDELRSHVYSLTGLEAVNHVFRVASSLDSMVLGEPQILGQLKDAYRLAVESETTGTILNRLMHKAFSVAKRIRTETSISKNAVSISYAAVELAKEIFEDLSRQRVLLIGAGEMAELAAEHLLSSGVREIMITNRTFSRARDLARRFNGQALDFDDLLESLPLADIVVSSTGASDPVIQARDMGAVIKKRKYKPMFFIDIAVPRDIDPDLNQLDNIYLYDIDDLKGVVEDNLAKRREESKLAQSIIDEEVGQFENWLSTLDLKPAIVDLLNAGQAVGRQELDKTLKKFSTQLTPKELEALQTMVAAIGKKLYHPPIAYVKTRARNQNEIHQYTSLLREMFNLNENQG